MTSKKLRKYLAYYQKTLREEPDNIEARLRLAAVFRDMGREVHAIEEYGTASRLLAREGLALEAIAACKAILELSPHHTDTQLFLARMYARVPDANGGSARIARPLTGSRLDSDAEARSSAPRRAPTSPSSGKPFELGAPKKGVDAAMPQAAAHSQGLAPPEERLEKLTTVGRKPDEQTVVGASNPVYEKFLASQRALNSSPDSAYENTRHTVEMAASDRDAVLRGLATSTAPRDDLGEPTSSAGEEELATDRQLAAEQRAALRRTQDIDENDILLEEPVDGVTDDDPVTDEFKANDHTGAESFEAGVFDMSSLRLDKGSSDEWDDLAFLDELDELDEPDTGELTSILNSRAPVPVLSVNRADLPHIPLFSDLDASTFLQLLELMEYRVVAPGTHIIEPGRSDPSLFVIVRGTAVVERNLDDERVELARMGEGEFFGEFALLTGRSEMASVRAHGELAVLEVGSDVLHQIAQNDPLIWDVLWDFYYARVLNNLVASSTIFRTMTEQARQRLTGSFFLKELQADQLLAQQGTHDDHLYLICFGEVQVEMRRIGQSPRVIDTLHKGQFIGLISSASNQPMVADIRALCDTSLLALPGEDFRRAVASSAQIKREVGAAVEARRQRAAFAGDAAAGNASSYNEVLDERDTAEVQTAVQADDTAE